LLFGPYFTKVSHYLKKMRLNSTLFMTCLAQPRQIPIAARNCGKASTDQGIPGDTRFLGHDELMDLAKTDCYSGKF
jgi:hypothetical protein